jgi:Protein of unknown function (DUF5661)
MSEKAHFTADEARAAGEQIGETDVTDDDESVTAKIARAHLNEFPDCHSRLAVMEAEAEAYRAKQGE